MNELALFAGGGGGILGGKLLGWRTVCAVEFAAYPRSVLLARQRDGILEPFPIWDDVRTFDGKPWRGRVDVVSGGFPCQDISAAGKGAGITGERSGLWKEFARIIGEVRPKFVLVENSPVLTSRGLGVVLGDLARMGYDARWGVISAIDAGLDHGRRRIWILAHPIGLGVERLGTRKDLGGVRPSRGLWERRADCASHMRSCSESPFTDGPGWPQPLLRGTKDEFPHWMDRIKSIGNGQVPAVVRLAWETLNPK